MSAINVYFQGTPGPNPVRYLGVFDDAGNPLNLEEWRQIAPDKWSLRVVCEAIDDLSNLENWGESRTHLFFRIWRTQPPGISFLNKLGNVLQSMRAHSDL